MSTLISTQYRLLLKNFHPITLVIMAANVRILRHFVGQVIFNITHNELNKLAVGGEMIINT